MNIKRYFEPAGHVLSTTPESKSFLLFSFLIFIFLRVLLLWGYHNLFHMVYLLIAFSFFQITILSSFIMQKIKDALTLEEHFAMKKSAILIGYIWSLLLYMTTAVVWIIDLWQIQSGVAWPLSNYTPDAALILVIIFICVIQFPMTVSAIYWQWDSFQTRTEDMKLVLDESSFRIRSITTFFVLAFVFISLLGLKSVIEGELLLPPFLDTLTIAVLILLVMIIINIGFFYGYRRKRINTAR